MMITLFIWLMCTNIHQSSPLNAYQWENRIIVVTSDQQIEIEKQVKKFQDTNEAFQERDLILVTIYQNKTSIGGKPVSKPTAKELRSYYDLPNNSFRILLIGKDGGIKASEDRVIEAKRFYDQIDSMPMRKAEMRRSDKGD